jgi:hypothetical protein
VVHRYYRPDVRLQTFEQGTQRRTGEQADAKIGSVERKDENDSTQWHLLSNVPAHCLNSSMRRSNTLTEV